LQDATRIAEQACRISANGSTANPDKDPVACPQAIGIDIMQVDLFAYKHSSTVKIVDVPTELLSILSATARALVREQQNPPDSLLQQHDQAMRAL